jgi:DNA-directed RNA polymerase specialized sigma24 family protein
VPGEAPDTELLDSVINAIKNDDNLLSRIVDEQGAGDVIPVKPVPKSDKVSPITLSRIDSGPKPKAERVNPLIAAAKGTAKKKTREELDIEAMRNAVNGDQDSLTELLGSEKEAKAVVDDWKKFPITDAEKALALAEKLRFENPENVAKEILATKEATEASAAAATKKSKVLSAINDLVLKNNVRSKLMDKQGAAADAARADELAITILEESIGPKLGGTGAAAKAHKLLMDGDNNIDYQAAVKNLVPQQKSDVVYTAAEKRSAARVIDDPELKTVAPEEILAPAPQRIPYGADTAEAVSKNERDVDRHLFRKLNYLKSLGRTDEAQDVINDIAEHYKDLPDIVASNRASSASRDEIIARGKLHLMKIINDFDYTTGFKFRTFATTNLNRNVFTTDASISGKAKVKTDVNTILEGLARKNAITADEMATHKAKILASTLEKHRPVMKLRFEGKKVGDIAKELGVTEKTVRSTLKSANDAASDYMRRNNLKPVDGPKDRAVGIGGDDDIKMSEVEQKVSDSSIEESENSVAEMLRLVGDDERKLLEMSEIDGLTYKEIAEKLGLKPGPTSENKVGNMVRAARSKLGNTIRRVAHAQAETPKREAVKALYAQNKAAYDEIVSRISDASLRERYARMLDVGDHLFLSSKPVLAFNRYFDKSTHGLSTYEEQKLARKRYRAAKAAIFEARQLLASITQAVGEHGILDEYGTIREMVNGGMKTSEAKKAARELVNKRNSEMVRYMEGAVDANGVPSGLDRSLFKNEDVAAHVESLLDVLMDIFPSRLRMEGLAGLSDKALVDIVNYFPRMRYFEHGPRTQGMDEVSEIFDTTLSSQKKRKGAFKGLPGGGAVINELSTDPDISGQYWKQARIGKSLSSSATDSIVDKLLSDKYRSRVFQPEHFDETGKLTSEGRSKAKQIAATLAKLPTFHAAQNIPIFGNNMLHTMSKYIQDSIAAEGVARVAQDVVARNVLPAGSTTAYTVGKLLEDINMDRHQAYMNIISSAGRNGEYKKYAAERMAELKETLAKKGEFSYDGGRSKLILDKDGVIKTVPSDQASKAQPRAIPDEILEEELNFGKGFANDFAKMSVDKDTYEAAKQHLVAWRVPKPIGDIQRFFNAMLQMFKTNVTLPFPSFHVRNGFSGQMQNFFYGAYDPTDKGPMRYFKPISQSLTIRNGQTVKGLYDELPKHIREMIDAFVKQTDGAKYDSTDNAATEWVRHMVFKYGITGDKQGYAAEQIGESFQNLVSQYPGYKNRNASYKNLWGFLREPQVGVSVKDRANLLHVRGGGRPAIVEDELGKRSIGVKAYEETTSTLHRTGEDLAMATEDINRISPFLAFLKQGSIPEEAARKVQRIQIDYSDLTDTEKTIRQFVPFYTFSSKIMYLTMGDLFLNPGGKQAWAIRAANRAQDPESLAPEHVKRGVAIPVGQTATGADRYLSGLGLAFEDPVQFAGVLRGDIRGVAGEIFGRVRPEAQGLAELATGRSLFFDRNLDDMDPPIGRTLSNIKNTITGEETKGLAEPFISPGVEWLVGKSPASRFVSTATKLTDTRKNLPYKLANTATGFRFTDVEPDAKERIAIDMASKLLKEEFGGREFARTYIPDWQEDRLSEDKKEQLAAIQSFISDVQKQTRDRKKQAEGLAGSVSGVAGDFN